MDDSEEDSRVERFFLMWDMYGLEMAINMDGCVSKRVEAALIGKPHMDVNLDHLLQTFLLRARFNSHRNYEVYAIGFPSGTTEDEVVEMFNQTPQVMVDLIRKKGLCLHGNSISSNPVIY